MKKLSLSLIVVATTLLLTPIASAQDKQLDRTILPIEPPPHKNITTMDVRNAKAPKRFVVKAPDGAPNVVLVLIDDIGFGASSTFGGPIPTPHFDRLAKNGLRFNHFHTTSLCSPTRASLLSGRNHHRVNEEARPINGSLASRTV